MVYDANYVTQSLKISDLRPSSTKFYYIVEHPSTAIVDEPFHFMPAKVQNRR